MFRVLSIIFVMEYIFLLRIYRYVRIVIHYKRKLWYSDIQLNPGDSYFPFVHFALTSFQPNSIEDAHLSRVNMSLNFIQIALGRYVSYALSEQDPKEITISFSGITDKQKLEQQKIIVEVILEENAKPRDDSLDT